MRIDILDSKPLKRGRGRVDDLLRMYADEHEQPLTLAFIEAKRGREGDAALERLRTLLRDTDQIPL